MYKVCIRADGGCNIGMGHIMRCISLGKMFEQKGCEVFFISKYKEGKEAIKANGFDIIPLTVEDKGYNIELGFTYEGGKHLESEKEELANILKNKKVDIFIIDHYNVTEDTFMFLKSYVSILAYIDDVNAFTYPVDVVINGNITGKHIGYKSYFKEQQFLLGPSYNLIREEFKHTPIRNVFEKVKKIMVTTGASDSFGVTGQLIDMVRSENLFNEIELHVIMGNSFINKAEIKEKQSKYKNIVIYENIEKISKIMLNCDIALSSCGSTLYELCACGVPTLGFILAKNQAFIAEKMDELGYIKNLGWYYNFKEEEIIRGIKFFINNFESRKEMVEKQQNLVDGRGTERVVGAIIKMMKEKEGVTHEKKIHTLRETMD
ncbi:UDP-2,4-diacetamido-2,4,6-trideoxy-beta-L-altropyranose hydrolase [Clostridium formicaceticum]|uniref:UDP-2,4-diacetamido-2,4, 6-trideoxy-beta-L-altropyranose hydrolase n=1 Tax=Clostridium formicaceticum TaxID=1497 RepID=A0AAC9RFT6_9CLOT|nr:UDP-2,4-diacetamido-2,4,6-trideoxy-beta-L-altropyranose hydrolase [Clostridium formicaceticum]AOY75670.1 UDP-2,4-diacetamido-2,4,6-trideoxy-beta-L-altropyranose hydrolase [Clostridium formicaceticum]ARE85986.1 UDP-2,4-diacetamido-2,4,6-trideoxy-beta-L-altropyranose hydrolase [Clostridium formicaceticum]